TFNLAGLHTSNIVISNEGLRARFEKTLGRTGFLGVGPFGIAALEAAYDRGESWLEQVLAYIGGNLRFLMDFIRSGIPRIGVVAPEGTYLVWIDCRGLGMEPLRLERFWIEEAKVRVDQGSLFGKGGEGFVRMNIACPRVLLEQALGRLKRAVDKRTRLRT
ncbi:MAG TPA: aminotransferase, partial [Syntrophales bacterium]|nr:aminotransferase [Syntrophales bacterium]